MKIHRRSLVASVVIAGFVALTLALSSGMASVSASESNRRNGQLHATKECSQYTGGAGSFCTITSSSLAEIMVGSKLYYDQALGTPSGLLDSNAVLDAGNGNRAVGRVTFDLGTGLGLLTFSDGTGQFAGFQARVKVTFLSGPDFALDGTYSFGPEPVR